MTFNDHLQHLVERALASIPAADAGDIYAFSFLIDNEDDDPRQPTLTVGYNTEAQARRSIQDASDQAEARWLPDPDSRYRRRAFRPPGTKSR